jgi:hypothetical protein
MGAVTPAVNRKYTLVLPAIRYFDAITQELHKKQKGQFREPA